MNSKNIVVNGDTTTLKHAGLTVEGSYNCAKTKVTSLVGCPQKVRKSFICNGNHDIYSLKGCPEDVGKLFKIFRTNISSLGGIYRYVRRIGGRLHICNRVKYNILAVLKIWDLNKVSIYGGASMDLHHAVEIINKYLKDTPNPMNRDIQMAQEELIEAGLEEFANLGHEDQEEAEKEAERRRQEVPSIPC